MNLTIYVPSRGRPENAERLANAFNDTCSAETELVFIVEPDQWQAYMDCLTLGPSEGQVRNNCWVTAIESYATTPGMVAALNYGVMNEDYFLADYIGFMGDDHLPRTRGWDYRYIERLAAGNLFVYGNDLLQGEAMPTQIAMNSQVVKALGYMAPPVFKHLCIDLVWKDWGKALDRIEYLDDVIVEHLHPANGKAPWDEHYQRVNNAEITTDDAEAYYHYRAHGGLAADAIKLWELLCRHPDD